MVIVIIVGFYYGGFEIPLAFNIYSPPAAYMNPYSSTGQVYGQVVYTNDTPAAGIIVRLFGTDELIEELVTTDHEGFFRSATSFKSGQIIRVTVLGFDLDQEAPLEQRQEFIDYNMEEDFSFDLGVFVIAPIPNEY